MKFCVLSKNNYIMKFPLLDSMPESDFLPIKVNESVKYLPLEKNTEKNPIGLCFEGESKGKFYNAVPDNIGFLNFTGNSFGNNLFGFFIKIYEYKNNIINLPFYLIIKHKEESYRTNYLKFVIDRGIFLLLRPGITNYYNLTLKEGVMNLDKLYSDNIQIAIDGTMELTAQQFEELIPIIVLDNTNNLPCKVKYTSREYGRSVDIDYISDYLILKNGGGSYYSIIAELNKNGSQSTFATGCYTIKTERSKLVYNSDNIKLTTIT